ncbi:ATP-grasp domain-containing protein [Mesorhizobium sp. M1380]|uniref:ATP-grasp domain-containing protein n=1 Tax=Mesorhizobium sp. M1380 TaxID=2957093 RepID=UPI00333BBEFB
MASDAALSWQAALIDRQVHISPYDGQALAVTLSGLLAQFERVGVLTYDERAVVQTALSASACRAPSITLDAAKSSRDKYEMRRRFAEAGLSVPAFELAGSVEDAERSASRIGFPVVLKPRFGLMSQGVVRVDNFEQIRAHFARIKSVAETHAVFAGEISRSKILIEKYLPGREIAVDGIVDDARFEVIGIFDKPEMLEGPYFEETFYITPSIEPQDMIMQVLRAVAAGAGALGLRQGPVHAELRIESDVATLIEIAARPIGGLCGRAYTYCLGTDYHDLVLRAALGLAAGNKDVETVLPSGVLMVPVPERGILRAINGVEEARQQTWVRDVFMMAKPGDRLSGFPEQDCYLGFIIASGPSRADVQGALKRAHSCLNFVVEPD